MLDKNGTEIRTGDIVRISGSYFKNDNGLYFVENSDGDPNWTGKDHSLRKISKTGKISTAKYNICFWPIMITTNSYEKRAAAYSWNKEHAEIEVVKGINRAEVVRHFQERAGQMEEEIKYNAWHFGEDGETVQKSREIKKHFEGVANRIQAEA